MLGKARIDDVGSGMSAEERQNIIVLDFPKLVHANGKDYLVKELFASDVHSRFPKLKKVRIPEGAASWEFHYILKRYSIEVEEY